MIAEWLAWGQAHSVILPLLSTVIGATGTLIVGLISFRRYLAIYQTHVSLDFFRS